jgi:hypothetical protein
MMAKIQTATGLRDYAYRKLGSPKIEIQVDDTQALDRIDDTIQLFIERHFDGAVEEFIVYEFTQEDATNKFLTLDDSIIAVTRIYEPGRYSSEAMNDVRYKIMADEMFDMTKASMTNYEITMQHLDMVSSYFNPDRTFSFNKATNQLHSHSGKIIGPVCSDDTILNQTDCETASGTWTRGHSLLLRAWKAVVPNEATGFGIDVYNDEWVKKYATAMIKQQWGANMKQFDGMPLPGGITVNGQKVWDEASEEITKLEEEFSLNYELPVNFLVG